jgi:effector-binding domain-containing protein
MITTPQLLTIEGFRAAAIHLVIPGREMPKYMDPAIAELLRVISAQGAVPIGPLFSYHYRRPSETFDFEIGFPVNKELREQERVRMIMIPSARIARTEHTGPYEGLAASWGELRGWVLEQKLSENGRFYESYLTNPDEERDPKKWRTKLNWVIK